MLRTLHSLAGLIIGAIAIVLSLSGAILSTDPALERLGTTMPAAGEISVADLAGRVARYYPGAEQIQRTPSGSVIVYYSQDGRAGVDRVDPFSGQRIAPYVQSSFSRGIRDLHRALFLESPGRAVAGLTALAILMLSISGAILLAKRSGGWRRMMRPVYGTPSQRWHAGAGRLVALGLLLSALTGIYMSAATFGLISDGTQNEPDFPSVVAGGPAAPVATLSALRSTDLNDLRELVYPKPGDPADVYSLQTADGGGYVDQATGALLSYRAHSGSRRVYETVYMLHTGDGLWWLGLLLGLSALGVPILSATGVGIWWQRRKSKPRITGNSRAQAADTIILVGSENNSTWGFAIALHDALTQAGLRVHTAPMNQLAREYRCARRLFLLTATYGDGQAPASASQFLARLADTPASPQLGFAVLGFGDRQFPRFCQFARDTEAALLDRGWSRLMPLVTIDRQSAQQFSRWGAELGRLIGRELTLTHTPQRPPVHQFELVDRVNYGEQVHAPTAVLRFAAVAPQRDGHWLERAIRGRSQPRFEAGDLAGIIPPGSTLPRFYSLASSSRDGVLEICVRKQPEGVCSTFLYDLQPGQRISAFIQPNPNFRPASGKAPVILIGAGTGIGPLAGLIRHNTARHPLYLYWGGRDPNSDFLYEPELHTYLGDHRLTELHAAFSRVENGNHVQDRIMDNAAQMRRLISQGAYVLICGSRAMAESVVQACDQILAPINLSVQLLKSQGRYREDVF